MSDVNKVEVPLDTGGAVDPDAVAQTTQIVSVHHNPGDALATQADLDNLAMKEDEPVADPEVPLPAEYAGIDTRSPLANLATRSNIVDAGPGSAGHAAV